jgi:uncharacterized membrane protein
MPHMRRVPERRHEPTRLEGFSDAVFAFALTLLVVSLEVPKTLPELLETVWQFPGFALMFAMVCWIWWEHNKFFRNYGLQDAWTAFLNSVLLFVILFYVYPLKFLTTTMIRQFHGGGSHGEIGDGRVVMLLYSSGVVMIFGTLSCYRHARLKRADLQLAGRRGRAQAGQRSHVISMSLGVLSMALPARSAAVDVGSRPHLHAHGPAAEGMGGVQSGARCHTRRPLRLHMRNAEVIRQVNPARGRSRAGPADDTNWRRSDEGDDAHHPPRSAGAAGSRLAIYDEGEENETKRWLLEVQPFRTVQEFSVLRRRRALSQPLGRRRPAGCAGRRLRAAFARSSARSSADARVLATMPHVLSTRGGSARSLIGRTST